MHSGAIRLQAGSLYCCSMYWALLYSALQNIALPRCALIRVDVRYLKTNIASLYKHYYKKNSKGAIFNIKMWIKNPASFYCNILCPYKNYDLKCSQWSQSISTLTYMYSYGQIALAITHAITGHTRTRVLITSLIVLRSVWLIILILLFSACLREAHTIFSCCLRMCAISCVFRGMLFLLSLLFCHFPSLHFCSYICLYTDYLWLWGLRQPWW